MTAMPEAILAREAQIAYASLALATDYDCWHDEQPDVTTADVLEVLGNNIHLAKDVIGKVLDTFPDKLPCSCHHAIRHSVITAPAHITPQHQEILEVLRS